MEWFFLFGIKIDLGCNISGSQLVEHDFIQGFHFQGMHTLYIIHHYISFLYTENYIDILLWVTYFIFYKYS